MLIEKFIDFTDIYFQTNNLYLLLVNLIIFGPPGAGKGTQSDKLIEKYDLTHIATGDLFRMHLGNNTPLGLEAKKYMEEGNLVPDKVVICLLYTSDAADE